MRSSSAPIVSQPEKTGNSGAAVDACQPISTSQPLAVRRGRPAATWRRQSSPLQRARRTCELAGFARAAEIDPDLSEWDYGDYEGLTSDEIRRQRPDWNLFRDGCVGAIDAHHGSSIPNFIKSLKRIQASDVEWLLPSHGPIFRKDDHLIDSTVARLETYLHMADFGTCAIDWPLMDQWERELVEGKMPE